MTAAHVLPAHLLIAAGAAVLAILGALHLLFTYRGPRLQPRDPAVRAAMEQATLVITRETTVGRAVKGFNASHSLGLITFGVVYGYLALARPQVLADSAFLLALGLGVHLAYVVLARRYFFRVPLRGAALAGLLYAAGWWLL